tara:strand:+ start:128 stop:1183 length:1056 start_codon:yes stop_codon:yes gene_type:complete
MSQDLKKVLDVYNKYLEPEDIKTFEEVIPFSFDTLMSSLGNMEPGRFASIFTEVKSINNPLLNEQGLQVYRSLLADRVLSAKSKKLGYHELDEYQKLMKDGFLILDDFLSDSNFNWLEDRVQEFVRANLQGGGRAPIYNPKKFYSLNDKMLTYMKMVWGVTEFYSDLRDGYPRADVDNLIHEPYENDVQKSLHTDTFHNTIKGWLYISDVEEHQGPFAYVRGSHSNTTERVAWDYENSKLGYDPKHPLYKSRIERRKSWVTPGSYRIADYEKGPGENKELKRLGYDEPILCTGKKNTLVLATTKGFHKRHEVVDPGTQRLCIQFQFRINPFPLVTEHRESYILGQDFLEEK